MKRFLVAIAIASLAISSCKNDNKKELLSQIESMENTLDSLEVIANDTSKNHNSQMITSVREAILKVKNHYVADTIDYELANQMNSYKDIRKGASKNSGNLAKVKQTIPEVNQKLDDLKHDIENGVNDREKYQEFIDYEKSKVYEIREVLNYYVQTRDEYNQRFDSLHPIIVNFGDSLERNANE